MPGVLCKGDIETAKLKEARAFAEGMQAAVDDISSVNPHADATSFDALAWDAGFDYTTANTPITRANQLCTGVIGAAAI
jgi:hypothetical protein